MSIEGARWKRSRHHCCKTFCSGYYGAHSQFSKKRHGDQTVLFYANDCGNYYICKNYFLFINFVVEMDNMNLLWSRIYGIH